MKILYIYNLYQQAGGENQWVESEPQLMKDHGHAVVTYKRDNSEIRDFSVWQKSSLLWQAGWSRQSYWEVRQIIRRERPQIAHVYNTLALVTPSVYYACGDESLPVVQTLYNYRLFCPKSSLLRDGRICEECIEHSLWRSIRYGCYRDSRIQTAAVAWVLYSHRRRGTWQDRVDAYLVPTEFMQRKFVEAGLPAEKVIVKQNFHEPDPGIRDQQDGSAVYLGRLAPEKGLRTLLAAWQRLKLPPLLRIIGDGPLRKELESVARNLPNGKIEFLGNRPHSEAIAYLRKAAFLILPSEWYEAFPHVIMEGYACGVPIIASRLGTLADLIEDGRTGILFEPGCSDDLASKVAWIVEHKNVACQMGQEGRVEYETKYCGKTNYQLLMAIYAGVLRRRGLPLN